MISELSKRYARALFEYATETGKIGVVSNQLEAVAEALANNHEVQEFVSSPVVTGEEKMAALKKALGGNAAEAILNLVGLLIEKNRIDIFNQVAQAFALITDEANGVTRGLVRSAAILNDDSRRKIETTVAGITHKKVILNYVEDKTIMGGLVAQVGGWTFDDSLQSHLIRMSEELNRRV